MKKLLAIMILAVLATALFGCGSSDDSTTAATTTEASTEASTESTTASNETGPTTKKGIPLMDDGIFDATVRYAASPEKKYSFYITEASASPGKISFEFVNPTQTPHNVAIEAPNGETIGETKTIGEGATKSHFVVKKGVYVLYCSVPGHRQKGMLGHLTVE